ncbi:DUF5077 domain-containing protein [Marinifilum fragile]|uniref:DUF5077 domain-containing protein n=1 Tax=Marinifilum fragile TaxID=570161 RepID=UPI0035713B51
MLKQFLNLLILGSCIVASISACGKSSQEENKKTPVDYTISVPIAGNSWVINHTNLNSEMITENGVSNWNNKESVIRTWFWVERAGEIQLGVRAKNASGESKVMFSFNNENKEIKLSNSDFSKLAIGSFTVAKSGYYYVDVKGVEKSGTTFGTFTDILIGGEVTSKPVICVKDDFYWGRRGPSVHLAIRFLKM